MPSQLKIARGFLSRQEARDLVDSTPDAQERLCWFVMLDLGLRLAETQEPSLADLQGAHVHIEGKGKRWRHVPTTRRVRETAKHLVCLPTLEYYTKAIPWRPRTIQARFHRALGRAGITRNGLSPHSLRHTYATTLVDEGIPITDVAALLGHANVATTSAYLHVSPKHLERAANALDRANGETTDAV